MSRLDNAHQPGRPIRRIGGLAFAVTALLFGALPATAQAATPPATATEVTSDRSTFSKTWKTADGQRITDLSAQPMHWRDRAGKWRAFDLRPETDKSSGRSNIRVGDASLSLPGDLRADPAIIVSNDGEEVHFGLEGAAGEPIRGSDGAWTTPEIFPGVTQRLFVSTSGSKEELVLRDAKSQRSFSYRLKLSEDLTPTETSRGDLAIVEGTKRRFTIPRIVLYERNDDTQATRGNPYRLTKLSNDTWRVTVDADGKWLQAKDRKWPVVVDPDVQWTSNYTNVECRNYLIESDQVGWGQCIGGGWGWNLPSTAQTIPVGFTGDSDNRAEYRFAMPPIAASRVVEARLLLTTSGRTTNIAAPNLAVHRQKSASDWSFATSESSWMDTTPADVRPAVNGKVDFDLSSEVRSWITTPSSNHGVTVKFANQAMPVWNDGADADWNSYQPYWEAPGSYSSIQVATSHQATVANRPVLRVYEAPPTQAGTHISAPAEGKLTSRNVDLTVTATAAGVTGANFQYVAGDSRDWQPIPLGALRYANTGAQPASQTISVPAGSGPKSSRPLIWDLAKTPGGQIDGPIHVRAILNAGSDGGGGISPERNFRLDRKNPETTSTETVGPANIDLLTGDASIKEADVNVTGFLEDLQLTRTYHSRGGTPRTTDMFGPGWIASVEADGGEMPYRGIYNFTEVDESQELVRWSVNETDAFWETYDWNDLAVEPVFETTRHETHYAVLEHADGAKTTFRKDGGTWKSDAEHVNLLLEGGSGNFSVKGADGSVTKFAADSAGSPNYRPTEHSQAGSTQKSTFHYASHGGRLRLSRVVAPTLAGITCVDSGGSWTAAAGCRAIELEWGSHVFAGKTEWRVNAVKLRAIDPSGQKSGSSFNAAQYEYDTTGRLKKSWDPRISPALATEYAYDSAGRLSSHTRPGERPWTFAYQTVSGDDGNGRVQSVTRKTPAGADATTTFVYDVPLSGTGAPNDLSPSTAAAWAQQDLPRTATAVFPPDSVPSGTGTPSNWTRATIFYLGVHGKTVNVADAEHNITTTGYDANGNIVRKLSARNRERALAASGSTIDRASELTTQTSYSDDGLVVDQVKGPKQATRLKDGSIVQGRRVTINTYDIGKPGDLPAAEHFLTTERRAVEKPDGELVDIEQTAHAYEDGGSTRGWAVKKPLKTTVGTGSEAATTRFVYHATYPLLVEKRMPKATGTDSHATVYSYYGVGSPPAWCSSGAGLSSAAAAGGMLCSATPGAGSSPAGTYTRYSLLLDPVEERKASSPATVGTSPLRVTTLGRDDGGRETSRTVTASSGRPIPSVSTAYHASTGQTATSTSAAISGAPARTISRTYDDNGRLATYTDADGGVTTYGYDLAGRTISIASPTGTRAVAYDARDLVSSVSDSTLAGAVTATRDADGTLVSQTLPGGLRKTVTPNESGVPISLSWERTTGCLSACTWVSNVLQRDAQGRIAKNTTLNSETSYDYDSNGRLARTTEQRGATCTTMSYVYDSNSNRASETKKIATSGAACGTGTSTTTTNSYNGIDQITNTGYAYDALGATAAVPASDAPNGVATTLTHDADGLLATSVAGSSSQTLERDPQRRLRSDTSAAPGLPSTTSVLRYVGDDDSPVAKSRVGGWERYIGDADGTVLATVTNAGATTWSLTDIHGDVVATAPSGATTPASKSEYTSFGLTAWSSSTGSPVGTTHGWLGAHGKFTAFQPGGLVHMGARTYNPKTGRFLQVDPIDGGSANAYDYAHQDPLNNLDLDGHFTRYYTVPKAKVLAMKIMIWANVGGSLSVGGPVGAALAMLGKAYAIKVANDLMRISHIVNLENGGIDPEDARKTGMRGVKLKVNFSGVHIGPTKNLERRYNYDWYKHNRSR